MFSRITGLRLWLLAAAVIAFSASPGTALARGHGGGSHGGGVHSSASFHAGGSFHGSPAFRGAPAHVAAGRGFSGGGGRGFSGSVGRGYSGFSGGRGYAVSPGYRGVYRGNYYGWNRGNYYANRGWYNNGWWWGGAPWVYPWLGYYGGYYPSYYGGYGYDYSPTYVETPAVVNTEPFGYAGAAQTAEPIANANNSYLDDALAAFRDGSYSEAMRDAGHALVDSPQDQTAHQIMELSLMATNDYRGAAMEAHAVVQFGGVPTWDDVYGLYGNVDTYTTQLRGLEKFVRDNPQAPEGQFLLGYQYLTLGYSAPAHDHLALAVKDIPSDKIAQQLLSDAAGNPRQAAKLPSTSRIY